jgi:hypothetical protein
MSWDYIAKWFKCEEYHDWWFSHGTIVQAETEDIAKEKIKNYKLSQNLKQVQQTEPGRWLIQFDDSISIVVESDNMLKAISLASWRFYLDKREIKNLLVHWQASF